MSINTAVTSGDRTFRSVDLLQLLPVTVTIILHMWKVNDYHCPSANVEHCTIAQDGTCVLSRIL